MKFTIVLAALVSLASGEWSCESCTAVVNSLAKHMTSADSIAAQTEILLSEICPTAPDSDQCTEELPGFWTRVALVLWPKYYDPQEDFMCGVDSLCGQPDTRLQVLHAIVSII